jgi:hypothetical protein
VDGSEVFIINDVDHESESNDNGDNISVDSDSE